MIAEQAVRLSKAIVAVNGRSIDRILHKLPDQKVYVTW